MTADSAAGSSANDLEIHRIENVGWLRAAVARVTFWSALAMAVTAGIGALAGTLS
ncbi:hypothetical protein [Nevskia soli]|uniref:hypothetical protein n=1 Tax=Nevskia soli TaxID=418856 RepID=UPI001B8013F0|nr:hypothetical protein [Nevskia soli]